MSHSSNTLILPRRIKEPTVFIEDFSKKEHDRSNLAACGLTPESFADLICYLREDEFFFWWREAAGLSPAVSHVNATSTSSLESLHLKDPIAQKQRKHERLQAPPNPTHIDKSQARNLCLLLLQRGVHMFKRMMHDAQFLKKKKGAQDKDAPEEEEEEDADSRHENRRRSKWTQLQINHLVSTYLPQLLPGTFDETIQEVLKRLPFENNTITYESFIDNWNKIVLIMWPTLHQVIEQHAMEAKETGKSNSLFCTIM